MQFIEVSHREKSAVGPRSFARLPNAQGSKIVCKDSNYLS